MSHEEYNAATGWVQLPDMLFATEVDIRGSTLDGGTFTNPMWANVGGSLEPTHDHIEEPLSWLVMDAEKTALFPITPDGDGLQVVSAADTDANWALQHHYIPLAGNYRDFFQAEVAGFPVVDYDPEEWRFATAQAAQSAFGAANPDVDFYEVEWEGYDTREPVGPFGTHRDRRLDTFRTRWEGEQWSYMLVDDQLEIFPVTPPINQPPIEWIVPHWESGMPGAFEVPLSGLDLVARQWSVQGVRGFGTGLGFYGEMYDELLISDAAFEAHSHLVTNGNNGHGNPIYTLGMPLWAVADFGSLINPAGIYNGETRGRVTSQSTFTPPRFRIRYLRETTPSSYRRIFPRDDGLAGGARRNYPPSRAIQSGNRNVGGYL